VLDFELKMDKKKANKIKELEDIIKFSHLDIDDKIKISNLLKEVVK